MIDGIEVFSSIGVSEFNLSQTTEKPAQGKTGDMRQSMAYALGLSVWGTSSLSMGEEIIYFRLLGTDLFSYTLFFCPHLSTIVLFYPLFYFWFGKQSYSTLKDFIPCTPYTSDAKYPRILTSGKSNRKFRKMGKSQTSNFLKKIYR